MTRLSGFGYSGAVLIVRDNKVIIRKGYGFANRDEKIPNTPNTVFDVGSFAKTFTAAAILQLDASRKLKITDPIGKYLSNVPADKTNITIQQILTHTSGLRSDFGTYEDITREQALERIFKIPLGFAPGSKYAYSNGGYVVLAAIVESAAGVPYRAYIKKNIFEPVGMTSTGFWGKLAPPVKPSLIARGHNEFAEAGNPLKWSDTTWYDLGGGMVLSTVDDLYKWVSALKDYKILSREATARMLTPAAPETLRDGRYGYGWWIKETPQKTLIHHGGDSTGFGALVSWYKEENLFIINLCNIRHDWYPTRIRADRNIPKILFGESYTLPPDFIAAGTNLVEDVVGTYQLPTGGKLTIQMFSGQLQIGAVGQDAVTVLTDANEEQQKTWINLSELSKRSVEGLFKKDFAAFDKASGNNPNFRNAVIDELSTMAKGKGDFKEVKVLGTYPPGFPNHIAALLQIEYEKGNVIYRIHWNGETIGATFESLIPLTALTPLQAKSNDLLVGWHIILEKSFQITVERAQGSVTGIKFFRDNRQWLAERIN